MAVRWPLIAGLIITCSGCSGPGGVHPHLQDIRSSSRQVVSDTRAMVVGRHMDAVKQVINDLQQVGFRVMQENPAQSSMNAQTVSSATFHEAPRSSSPNDFASEADVLVVVEVDGLGADLRTVVNGIDLATGELLWHGGSTVAEGDTERGYDQTVRRLASRALFNGLNTLQHRHKAVASPLMSEALEAEISRRFSIESMLADQHEMFRCPSRCHR